MSIFNQTSTGPLLPILASVHFKRTKKKTNPPLYGRFFVRLDLNRVIDPLTRLLQQVTMGPNNLLNLIKITNNRLYDMMPVGKRRHALSTIVDNLVELNSPPKAHGLTEDTLRRELRPNARSRRTSARLNRADRPGLYQISESEPLTQETEKRIGRPRLYLASVVEKNSQRFLLRIKYNTRNRVARRLLSTLKPEAVTQIACGDSQFRKKNRGRPILARRPPISQQAKIMEEDFEPELDLDIAGSELPYKGVLDYPDCTINDTDPTAYDREMFAHFHREGEQRKQMEQLAVIRSNGDETDNESRNNTPMLQLYYYLKSRIEKIQFREYIIDTWYSSPYPEEFSQSKILYICEYCLKYMKSPMSYQRHRLKICTIANNHPPGVEIYRDIDANVAIWEVDGRKNIEYCQNLCLLAKLFLNSKTLYYDVEPFLFYVLTEIDELDPSQYHFVGYFSKEKLNNSDFNVSCIVTLPIYQKKGYGSLLIDFSYLLSRHEFKFGTPEKPLSDLGLASYRSYWKTTIANVLRKLYDRYLSENSSGQVTLSLEVLSKLTGMKPSDVVVGLEQLKALVKSQTTGEYAIMIDLTTINKVLEKQEQKGYVKLKENNVLWKPIIYGPSGGINSAPAYLTHLGKIGTLPAGNPPAAVVSNSISLISQFLKDDINSPYTYEEEAFKEIDNISSTIKENQGLFWNNESNDNFGLLIICDPEYANGVSKVPNFSNSNSDLKVADDSEGEESDETLERGDLDDNNISLSSSDKSEEDEDELISDNEEYTAREAETELNDYDGVENEDSDDGNKEEEEGDYSLNSDTEGEVSSDTQDPRHSGSQADHSQSPIDAGSNRSTDQDELGPDVLARPQARKGRQATVKRWSQRLRTHKTAIEKTTGVASRRTRRRLVSNRIH